MILLGILCFLGAAISLYFAFKPKEAFYLDEGWKFKDKVEPSDAYIGINGIGRIVGAVLLVGVGIGAISMHVDEKRTDDETAATATSKEKCENEVLPRFKQTVRWNGTVVANPDEVRALGRELNVEVQINRGKGWSVRQDASIEYDDIRVSDPKKPGNSQVIFSLSGQYLPDSRGWGLDRCY